MSRGMKDEGYVSHALSISEHSDGRWLGRQAYFDRPDAEIIDPKLKAMLVASTAIYASKFAWPESDVQAALSVQTYGDARALVDQLRSKID